MTQPFKARPDAMVVQYNWGGFPEGSAEATLREWTGEVPYGWLADALDRTFGEGEEAS